MPNYIFLEQHNEGLKQKIVLFKHGTQCLIAPETNNFTLYDYIILYSV